MRIFPQSRNGFAHRVICATLASALLAPGIFAQQPAAAPAAGPMLTLPGGWKELGQDANPSNTPLTGARKPDTDPQLVNLLITAASVDPKRDMTLSLFRYRFHEYGVPTADGGPGLDWESGKIAQAVLMQGYMPVSEQAASTVSAQNQPLLTIEITAKNAAGETRIFTDTTVTPTAKGANSYRLYTSRPAADAAGAQEIAAIIKSLNIPADDTLPTVAQNPNAAPVTPTAVQASVAPPIPDTGAATPGANATQTAAQIVQDYHSALIVVEGNKGLGSGFLCKMDGHNYIITNAHVLADNAGVKLTGLDGTSYASGSSAVAVGHDVVKLEVAGAIPKAFEVMTNLDSTVKIGDAVMIPGNAEGEKVVTAEEGKVVGIGPDLIEVDAPFVPGNSGSPIVHVATGKVLGVATYLSIKKVNKDGAPGAANGAVVEEIRRFGYRIDSVKQWQPINWQIFYAESQQLTAIEDLSDDFINMFNKGENFTAADCKTPTLARVVRDFIDARNQSSNASKADQEEQWRRFLTGLRATTQGDITTFNSQPSYDYFRREVAEQARLRGELFDFFSRLIQNGQSGQ